MDRSREDEYAEAFRRGYERARRSVEPTIRLETDTLAAEPAPWTEEVSPEEDRPEPVEPPPPARDPEPPDNTDRHDLDLPWLDDRAPRDTGRPPGDRPADDDRRRSAGWVLAALAVMAVFLVLAAYGLGRLFAESTSGDDTEHDALAGGAVVKDRPQPAPYDGPVHVVDVAGSTASCQSPSSVDAAGNPVTYDPSKAHDSDLSTAWRCPGSGARERLTLSLGRSLQVAEVGLVPGYAKTDPVSGDDRYAENNRITKVRWIFDDGSMRVQRMSGDPADRRMRTLRVPSTATRSIVIEIVSSRPGPRNTVAISEVHVATPSG